jgi:hypothetical protein
MEPNTGSNINVVGITGEGNEVRNIDGMNITGAKLTQGSSSSKLFHSINVTGISGIKTQVSNITDVNIVGVDLTQPQLQSSNSPAVLEPAPGTVKREINKINSKQHEALNKIGEGRSCK